jgi:hypothetical protein
MHRENQATCWMMSEKKIAREKFEKALFPRIGAKKNKQTQRNATRMSEDATKRVRVVARVRPVNAKEMDEPLTILDAATGIVPDGSIRATLPMSAQLTRELTFNFSAVAGARATQADVYAASAKSLVAPFLNGVNCAVLAYGNTSSGKTFTMMGPSFADEVALAGAATLPSAALTALASHELAGVIPRMLADVFDALARTETIHTTQELRCSFVEVYREECFDLLVTDSKRVPLHMRENKAGEVLLPGARCELVTSIADVMSLLERGSRHRIVACTNANRDSSRGHAIFLVSCRRTDKRTKFATESQLYLCDLAGSEKIVKTGVTGVQLKEAAAINQSLLALGNVIQALSTGDAGHVPFRSSKLTRLLKSPLSSATVLIVCVSPSSLYAPETVATLRFGDRSQLIKGHARVNAVRSIEFLEHALARAEARIAELEAIAASERRHGRLSDGYGDRDDSDGDHDDSGRRGRDRDARQGAVPRDARAPLRIAVDCRHQECRGGVADAAAATARRSGALFVSAVARRVRRSCCGGRWHHVRATGDRALAASEPAHGALAGVWPAAGAPQSGEQSAVQGAAATAVPGVAEAGHFVHYAV